MRQRINIIRAMFPLPEIDIEKQWKRDKAGERNTYHYIHSYV